MALAVTDALRIDSDLYFETKLRGPQRHKFAYEKTQLNHAEDSLSTQLVRWIAANTSYNIQLALLCGAPQYPRDLKLRIELEKQMEQTPRMTWPVAVEGPPPLHAGRLQRGTV